MLGEIFNMKKRSRRDRLVTKHDNRFRARKLSLRHKMTNFWALCFRPGDQTDSFLGKMYRPFGQMRYFVQFSEVRDEVGKDGSSRSRDVIHLQGYHAQQDQDTGDVFFGGADGNDCAFDFGRTPYPGNTGSWLDCKRNPSLVNLGLDMDKHRFTAANRSFRLSSNPLMPIVYHAFRPGSVPEPVDSFAIRERIAKHMTATGNGDTVTPKSIGRMTHEQRDLLIKAEWSTILIAPGDKENNTGYYLIASQFYPHPSEAVTSFEYVGHLVGAEIHNPATTVAGLQSLQNPAPAVAAKLGIELGNPDHEYTDEEVEKLFKRMRQKMGQYGKIVTDDSLAQAVDNPTQPIVIDATPDLIDTYGAQATIRMMRKAVGIYGACCLDEDLLDATRNVNRPVRAAGLAKIQVLAKAGPASKALKFGSNDLGMNATADFCSVKPWMTI